MRIQKSLIIDNSKTLSELKLQTNRWWPRSFARPVDVVRSSHLPRPLPLWSYWLYQNWKSDKRRAAKLQDSTAHHPSSLFGKILSWTLSTGDKYCIGEDQPSPRQNSQGNGLIFGAHHTPFSMSFQSQWRLTLDSST